MLNKIFHLFLGVLLLSVVACSGSSTSGLNSNVPTDPTGGVPADPTDDPTDNPVDNPTDDPVDDPDDPGDDLEEDPSDPPSLGLTVYYEEDFEEPNSANWPTGWSVAGADEAIPSPVLSHTIENGRACLQGPQYMGGDSSLALARMVYNEDLFQTGVRVNTQVQYENYPWQGVGIYIPHNGEFLNQNDILGKGYVAFIQQAGVGVTLWLEYLGVEYQHAFIASPIFPDDVILNIEYEVEQIADAGAPAGIRTEQRVRIWEAGTNRPASWTLISDDTPGSDPGAPANPQTVPELQNLAVGERKLVIDLFNYNPAGQGSVCFEYIQVTEIPTDPIAGVVDPVAPVAAGFSFAEGPVWLDGDAYGLNGPGLLFTAIPDDEINFYDPADDSVLVFRANQTPDAYANGMARHPDGRLIICEQGEQQVIGREPDGSELVIADNFGGVAFNSPNDVAVHSNGTIYFTDPDYGTLFTGLTQLLPVQALYQVSPLGTLTQEVSDFNQPNGVALSPDETRLYVSDTANSVIRAFNLDEDGAVTTEITSGGFPIATGGGGDGMAVDVQGNIYLARGAPGVDVFDPFGVLWGNISVPEDARNVAFGGSNLTTLYITTGSLGGGMAGGLYQVEVNVPGVALPDGS